MLLQIWLMSCLTERTRALPELGLGEEDSISHSALIIAAIESKCGTYILHKPSELL